MHVWVASTRLTCHSVQWSDLEMVQKIFFHLIDLYILNAFSIYKTVTGKSMPLANFQLEVIRQLLEKYSTPTISL